MVGASEDIPEDNAFVKLRIVTVGNKASMEIIE